MDQKSSSEKRVNPASTQGHLRYQQDFLKQSYPSCDMSEMSYHTEYSEFPGSRHSSLNTEPLTLDADEMHEAKDQAEDVLDKVGPEVAGQIFTTELDVGEHDSRESEAEALSKQLNSLVDKAQQVVEANELHSQSMGKTSGPSQEPSKRSGDLEDIIESVSAPSSPSREEPSTLTKESTPSPEESSSSAKELSPVAAENLTNKSD